MRLREIIDRGMSEGLHIGAQVYVSVRGEVVVDEAYGEARPGVAMTTNTLNCFLSSGKPLVAAGIALLWQRGLLGLDDRITKCIPEFGAGGKETVTIRHCLTHMAGIRAAATAWQADSHEQIIASICASKLEPNWIFGQSAGYHIASTWYILGAVIARVTGENLSTWMRREIFEGMGMKDTWLGMSRETWDGYGERIGQMQVTQPPPSKAQTWETYEMFSFARPANNARGTMRDLGRFYERLFSSESSVLSPQTVEAITTPKRVGVLDQTFKAKIDWGLGFICNSSHYGQMAVPYQFGPHASARTFGHAGNQSSIGMADPEHQLVIAILFNGQPGEAKHDRRMREVLGAVYEDLKLVGSPR